MRSSFTACRLMGMILLISASLPQATAQVIAPSYAVRFMSLETAMKAAQAALNDCRAQGFQVAVAVVDRAGLTQVLVRDRFAGAHTPEMAQGKAWTAASFRVRSSELASESQPGKPMSGIRSLPRVIAVGGGLPIEEGGTLWGAIGVSGAPGGDADESCARAGIKTVSDDLSF